MTSFELVLRRADNASDPGERFQFRLEPGQEIIFGRAAEVDITIPDPDRRVSSRHGRIFCSEAGELVASDLGSLNGTYLEGASLDPESGTPLRNGSMLRVSDYVLEIAPPQAEQTIDSPSPAQPEPGEAETMLKDSLKESYTPCGSKDPIARRAKIQLAVERVITELEPPESSELIAKLLSELGRSDGLTAPGSRATAPPTPAGTKSVSGTQEKAYDRSKAMSVLQGLASRLVPASPLESDADCEAFGAMLEQVCSSTLDWLAKGLQGRTVFAEEFGAEVTIVFQRSTNPLKAMSRDQLLEYLLDWRSEASSESRSYYLDAVLKDLTEHQVAVIAGLKEAVASIFLKLSPERIRTDAAKAAGWSKSAKAWNHYQTVHRELSEEQSKLFQEMITPAIQKGYLQQHGDD